MKANTLRKVVRYVFDKLSINRSVAFQLQFGNAYKAQQKLVNKRNPIIFDVGAFDGRTAVQYKKIFPNAEIHSFEPFADSFAMLQDRKVDQQHYLNNFALSNSNGEITFYVNKFKATNSLLKSCQKGIAINNSLANESIIRVQQKRLDDYCTEKSIKFIDILKIDVQGAELMVLDGAKNLLANKQVGLLYLETEFEKLYEDQPLFDDISQYLRSKGYVFFSLYNFSHIRSGRMVAADVIFVNSAAI